MVSSKVQIDTLSYQKGAQAVRWISTSGIEYEMEDSDRTERGTTVTLYIAEDSEEFLDFYKVRETLVKYFSFLPYEYIWRMQMQQRKTKRKAEIMRRKRRKNQSL